MELMHHDLATALKIQSEMLISQWEQLPEAVLKFKPSPDAWNVLEVIEHIVTVERPLAQFLQLPSQEVHRDGNLEKLGKEKIFQIMGDRSRSYPAPSFGMPKGRYKNIGEAVQYFRDSREKLAEALETGKISLDSSLRRHPGLGLLTNIDWIHFLLAHADRHQAQIEQNQAGFGS